MVEPPRVITCPKCGYADWAAAPHECQPEPQRSASPPTGPAAATAGPTLPLDAIKEHVLPNVEAFERIIGDTMADVHEYLAGWLTGAYAAGLREGWRQAQQDAAKGQPDD